MKRLLLLLSFLPLPLFAQTDAIQNHCVRGGTKANVSGLPSTNFQQGIIPSCQVTVYLTGTQNKATIYKDGSNTPLSNPFTANTSISTDPGGFIFWAATGQGYDVVGSGGIAPNVYPVPFAILTDVKVGGSGGGGGVIPGTQYNLPAYDTGGTNVGPLTHVTVDAATGNDLNIPGTWAAGGPTLSTVNPMAITAAEALLSGGGTLIVNNVLTIPATHSTPANIKFEVKQGGGFNVASGQTLTFGGPVEAGLYQVFFGSGTVAFTEGVITDVYAGWWYPGSGLWDTPLASALAACRSAVAWCDLPATMSTSGTLSMGNNSLLRPLSWTGAMNASSGYGTIWTHAPTTTGVNIVSTPGGSSTSNVKIRGISFVSGGSPNFSNAAIYLNFIIGCEVSETQASGPFATAGILASQLQDCKVDHPNVTNTVSATTMPAGIRFLGPESTPVGSLSTTTDLDKIVISGGGGVITAGLVFDGDACLGCNVRSPTIETVAQNAVNIGKGNTVDIYSPYTENVPATDSAFGVFRLGQDYPTAAFVSFVNIFGGVVKGTNTQTTHSNFGFDLGHSFNIVNVVGTQFGQFNTFQTNTGDCTTCVFTLGKANWTFSFSGGGFGTVTLPRNFNFMPDNRFYGATPSASTPSSSRQYGTVANAPPFYNSPGQLYYATDAGNLYVWNPSTQTFFPLPAPSTATGLFTINQTTFAGLRITGGTYSGTGNYINEFVDSLGYGHYQTVLHTYINPGFGGGNYSTMIGAAGTGAVYFNFDAPNGNVFGGTGGVYYGDGNNHLALQINAGGGIVPLALYSAAGTPLPTCVSGLRGADYTVIDATTPTYMGAYTSGGLITARVICSYNGTSYAWATH